MNAPRIAPPPEKLSLNTATVKAQWRLDEIIEGCARHGIRGISPWRDQVAEIGLARTAQLIRSHGLTVTGYCRGGMFPAADKAGPVGVAKVIYFDYDSYTVKPDYQSVVDQHARFLQSRPNARLVLEGNTDQRGSREYNLALGQKRAEAVRRALTLVGASDNQIEAVSFGKEKPAVEGTSEEAYAKNRRVEFRYQ